MQGGGFLFFFAAVLVLSRRAEGQNMEEGCGRQDGSYMVVQGVSGTISSPGHPAMYPSNSNCAWLVTTEEGTRIVIVFSALDIEQQTQCSYDYLQIRDGSETTAASLAKVCGNSIPNSVTSTGNNILINFRSDTSVGGEGFALEWAAECLDNLFSCDFGATCIDESRKCDLIQDCNDWADESEECLAQGLGAYAAFSGGCQSDIENIVEAGNLSTPNYPDFYIAGMDCSWSLAAAPESDGRYPVLMASFTGPFGIDCSSGSIQITTTDSNGAEVASTTVCGDQGGPVSIGAEDGQTMSLTFSPSSQPIGHGYEVEWSLCPPDSLACPEIGMCYAPETGVTTCPSSMPTTQGMATGAGATTARGGLAGTTVRRSSTVRPNSVTRAASDNSTMYTEDPDNTVCYNCEGTSRECMTGNGIGGTAMECQENEACWVERIGDEQNVSYRRSCQPACTSYWAYEICMTADGQDKVCKLCCMDDRCNIHVLTGHNDPRAPTQGGNSGAEGILTSLGPVSILAFAMCADILSLIA